MCCLLANAAWQGAETRGMVRDANGGEPLAGVRLELECADSRRIFLSGKDGGYRIPQSAGCQVTATLVGYRPLRVPADGVGAELFLTPDQLTRKDSLEVAAGPFEPEYAGSPSERRLSPNDLKNLAGVLADDPLRAVQSLPGAASNNDYAAQFSLRGASFAQTGVFVDGVLLHSPFHAVRGQDQQGSLTIFNTDVVDEVLLHAGAPPVRYQELTAGALDLSLRDGSRRGVAVRVNTGVASSGVLAEGPLSNGRGSWLAAVRKSYLQYLIRKSSAADSGLAFGFFDAQGRLTYDLAPQHQLTLAFLDGTSDLDRSEARDRLGPNAIVTSDYHFTVGSAAWRWSPRANATFVNRLAYMRERYDAQNPRNLPLGDGGYGEWVGSSETNWVWRAQAPLSAGVTFRRIHDDGGTYRWQFNPTALRRNDTWNATGLRSGGWAEQGFRRGRIAMTAGARWDHSSMAGGALLLPHGSATVEAGRGLRLQAAASQSAQFPQGSVLFITRIGNPALPAARANHFVGAIDQALGDRMRLRAEFYRRDERDLAWQPLAEPRLNDAGQIVAPPADPRYEQSLRGSARGVEIMLQRRSANALSGWISYGYSKAWMRDGILRKEFPSDFDQRHTLTAYGAWRFRPTWMLSARYSYGSNFPVPGFVVERGERVYFLANERNRMRIEDYQRADFRVTKSIQRQGWRATIYAEVVNLTGRENWRFDSYNGYNNRTGAVSMSFSELFPVLPAAGVTFEWDRSLPAR